MANNMGPSVVADPSNVGNVLMEMNAVSMDKLKEAVTRQMDQHGGYLGAILIAMGAITPWTLEYALRIQDAYRAENVMDAKLILLEYQTNRWDRAVQKTQAAADTAEVVINKLS